MRMIWASPTFTLESLEMLRGILSLIAALSLLCAGSMVVNAQTQGGTVSPLTTDCSSPASAFLPECAGLAASPYASGQSYTNGTPGQTSNGQGMYGGASRSNPFPRLVKVEMVPINESRRTSIKFRLGTRAGIYITHIWVWRANNR